MHPMPFCDTSQRPWTGVALRPGLALLLAAAPLQAIADCDCGSTDLTAPCTGQAISITVESTGAPRPPHQAASFHWQFQSDGGDAYCGQFANGDYWIAPRPGETLTLLSVDGNGSISLDANPTTEALGLLDGSNHYGNHDPSQDLIASGALPQVFTGITSLVAAKQRPEASDESSTCGTGAIVGECVDAYHVVTVLTDVPPLAGADTIRPPITGTEKPLLRWSDFDLSRLPSTDLVSGSWHNSRDLETIRRRWTHASEAFSIRNAELGGFSEGGRAFRAHIMVPDYGATVASTFSNDLVTLFSSAHSLDEKHPALAAMLSYGLDIYHARYSPPDGVQRAWGSGAGQWAGQYLPPAFLAALLRDPERADTLRAMLDTIHHDDPALRGPQELRQINIGQNGALVWGDEPHFPEHKERDYWSELFSQQCYDGAPGECDSSSGRRTQRDPYGYIDGAPGEPGVNYMAITHGAQRALVSTLFHMPVLCHVVDYPPLVEYIDRLHHIGIHTAPDPCAAPDPRENPACSVHSGTNCDYYGVTWGPDPDSPGRCITGSPGRFVSRHGSPASVSHQAWQAESNWDVVRGNSSFCMRAPQLTSVNLPIGNGPD
ncbi:MAG: hypothetical protein JJT90_07915 [Ectothiorhodospiraceae bacterium]|nr:hypothetical protein [Ectothiorhodospiraceae bacterium]